MFSNRATDIQPTTVVIDLDAGTCSSNFTSKCKTLPPRHVVKLFRTLVRHANVFQLVHHDAALIVPEVLREWYVRQAMPSTPQPPLTHHTHKQGWS